MSDIERVNEIEHLIAVGQLSAAQVFTQMKQLLSTAEAPASGEVEPFAWARFRSYRIAADDVIEGVELCDRHEIGDDGSPASPVYLHPPAKVPENMKRFLQWTDDRVRAFEEGIEIKEDFDDWVAELRRLLLTTPAPATTAGAESFQSRVQPWLLECFGAMIAGDKEERNHRFLEEALELVQSLGCTADEAHKLVDYVFSRPVGDPPQEVGGVQVTLAALCLANAMDMHQCGETELARITQPEMVEKIREKQKRKPSMSPLPGVYPDRPTPPQEQ